MTDSIPTTPNLPHDEQVQEVQSSSVPDVCGVQRQKSPQRPRGKAPVHKNSDKYNMDHPNRGTCLVFNHETYVHKVPERLGTNADVKRIQKTFKGLGFSVEVCHDYKCQDIKKKIRTLSQQDHADNDCLCIIVLTHGKGDNMIQARDELYPLNVLWEPFTANNCTSLAGKPKLFFISACRGNKLDKGVLLEFMSSVSPRKSSRTVTDGFGSSSYVIPAEADFLFGFSTAPGYYSWRSETEGTWYIQSLCDILDEFSATTHLQDMLTKTALEVAKRSSYDKDNEKWHNNKQVPEFHSRLLRSVHFTPGKQGAIISESFLAYQEAVTSEPTNSVRETSTKRRKRSNFHRCATL